MELGNIEMSTIPFQFRSINVGGINNARNK